MTKIDTRGKPCPQPVIMTKDALEHGETELEITLDNPISASNVMRFLESRGFAVTLKDEDGLLTINTHKSDTISSHAVKAGVTPKAEASCSSPCTSDSNDSFSVLITAAVIGGNDQQLGEVLMKSFLGTLAQSSPLPMTVALMNEGVKLAVNGTSSCDTLKELAVKSVTVLVCGTCVNHFNIGSKIGVGTISNMFEIVDTVKRASKVITL